MGRADFLREGDWNRICDRCGFKYKASDTVKDWQGLIVCPQCYEGRHPQDFVRGTRDRQRVPWSRPEPTENFIGFTTYFSEIGFSVNMGVTPGGIQIDTAVSPAVAFDFDLSGEVQIDRTYAPLISFAGAVTATVSINADFPASISMVYAVTGDVDVIPDGTYVDESGNEYVDESGDYYIDGT